MHLNLDPQSDLALAHRLADAADRISLSRYQSIDLLVETKPDATPVTDADRAIEEEIRAILGSERPDDLIIGEEFGGSELLDGIEPGRKYWVIDPIDGTKNFLRGVPTWATLIAQGAKSVDSSSSQDAADSGHHRIDVGVVSAPALGRRWWAARGEGSYLTENFSSASPLHTAGGIAASGIDGEALTGSTAQALTRSIAVSKVKELKDASISYSDLIDWGGRRDSFLALLDGAWRTRALGDFLSHMLVAEGAVDFAAEPSLALWDMAALSVIVEEAGGRFSSLEGIAGPFGRSGVSSNGLLHDDFLSRITNP